MIHLVAASALALGLSATPSPPPAAQGSALSLARKAYKKAKTARKLIKEMREGVEAAEKVGEMVVEYGRTGRVAMIVIDDNYEVQVERAREARRELEAIEIPSASPASPLPQWGDPTQRRAVLAAAVKDYRHRLESVDAAREGVYEVEEVVAWADDVRSTCADLLRAGPEIERVMWTEPRVQDVLQRIAQLGGVVSEVNAARDAAIAKRRELEAYVAQERERAANMRPNLRQLLGAEVADLRGKAEERRVALEDLATREASLKQAKEGLDALILSDSQAQTDVRTLSGRISQLQRDNERLNGEKRGILEAIPGKEELARREDLCPAGNAWSICTQHRGAYAPAMLRKAQILREVQDMRARVAQIDQAVRSNSGSIASAQQSLSAAGARHSALTGQIATRRAEVDRQSANVLARFRELWSDRARGNAEALLAAAESDLGELN